MALPQEWHSSIRTCPLILLLLQLNTATTHYAVPPDRPVKNQIRRIGHTKQPRDNQHDQCPTNHPPRHPGTVRITDSQTLWKHAMHIDHCSSDTRLIFGSPPESSLKLCRGGLPPGNAVYGRTYAPTNGSSHLFQTTCTATSLTVHHKLNGITHLACSCL